MRLIKRLIKIIDMVCKMILIITIYTTTVGSAVMLFSFLLAGNIWVGEIFGIMLIISLVYLFYLGCIGMIDINNIKFLKNK
jgi:hypothetical protein